MQQEPINWWHRPAGARTSEARTTLCAPNGALVLISRGVGLHANLIISARLAPIRRPGAGEACTTAGPAPPGGQMFGRPGLTQRPGAPGSRGGLRVRMRPGRDPPPQPGAQVLARGPTAWQGPRAPAAYWFDRRGGWSGGWCLVGRNWTGGAQLAGAAQRNKGRRGQVGDAVVVFCRGDGGLDACWQMCVGVWEHVAVL